MFNFITNHNDSLFTNTFCIFVFIRVSLCVNTNFVTAPPPTPTPTPTSPTTCYNGQVQLNPSFTLEGFILVAGLLEFCYNNTFSRVCDYNWDENDARVVCNSLGYFNSGEKCVHVVTCICIYMRHSTEAEPLNGSLFGEIGETVVTNFMCFGYESQLANCMYELVSEDTPCFSPAGVVCNGK